MLTPVLVALLQMAGPGAPAPCTAIAPPPAGLEAWRTTGTGTLAIGQRTSLTLTDSATTKFVVTPDRAPAAGTFSTVRPFTIAKPGTYRVALSAGAWIDLVDAKGSSLRSVAHTEGPACSGIRKIVNFQLAAGSYTIQLSGSKAPALYLLIAPK